MLTIVAMMFNGSHITISYNDTDYMDIILMNVEGCVMLARNLTPAQWLHVQKCIDSPHDWINLNRSNHDAEVPST